MDDNPKIQATIEMLLEIHESGEMIEDMGEVLGMGNVTQCRGQVANVIRYLMSRRDAEDSSDTIESLVEQECVHVLGMKASNSNTVYMVYSDTTESHVDHLKKATTVGSATYNLEWFEFCPRCGAKLDLPNSPNEPRGESLKELDPQNDLNRFELCPYSNVRVACKSHVPDSVFVMVDESSLKLEDARKLLKEGDITGSVMLINEHIKMNREAKKFWDKHGRTRGRKGES